MGACLDKPMIRVGLKTVKKSGMKDLKTFQDALRIAGYPSDFHAAIAVVTNNEVAFVYGYTKFYIVDEIVFKGAHIPIRRLYGRQP